MIRPSPPRWGIPLAAAIAITIGPSAATAQTARSVTDGYEDLIKAAQTVAAIGPELFGEQVNLQDGATSFRATDVAIKLTSGLPMAIGRKLGINAKDYDQYTNVAADGELFGNWLLDVPYMSGTFDERTGWISSMPNGQQRCSVSSQYTMAPPTRQSIFKTYNYYDASQYWGGNRINLPGAGEESLLYLPAGHPRPSDGRAYYGTTKSNWKVSCLPTILNGAGEGFQVVRPDGTRYTFNWMSSRRVSSIREVACNRIGCSNGLGLHRREVFLSATRVEDRFGNWVAYQYDPANPRRLLSVTSNEGAAISLAYTSNGKIQSITSHGRTWIYGYADPGNTTLASVTLPDTSRWTFAYDNIFQVTRSDAGLLWRDCQPPSPDQTTPPPAGQILTITHPAGAVGTFKFRRLVHGTQNTPGVCYDPDPDIFGDEQVSPTPAAYRIASLYEKAITGLGLAARSWSYRYTSSWSWAQECSPSVCPDNSTSQTQVTGPDGTVTRYTFGNNYQTNAGQLLAVAIESAGVAIKHTLSTFVTSAVGQPFPDAAGLDPQLYTNHLVTEKLRPLRSSVILQEGVTYTRHIDAFDAFARPTQVSQFSSLGASRVDLTDYHDQAAAWVLGQVARRRDAPTGTVIAETEFTASAQPYKTYAFGRLEATRTYHPDGTLAAVTDGNGNVTTVSSWKRGIPRLIVYPATADSPAGSSASAVVDDLGQVTSVTDETSATTSYTYDALGRLTGIGYPSNDSAAWTPKTLELRALTAADWRPPGISAGQWRHYVAQGNYTKVSYLDALWQPVLTHEYDAADLPGTLRATSTSYDTEGRAVFQSYPSSELSPPASGTRTFYDALGRVVRSEQDSEHGALVTTTEFLPGLQMRVTNARGSQSTTSFLAWDEPGYDLALTSQQPEGKVLEIARHPRFGWPLQLTQRSVDGSVQQTRRYVYDVHGKLCKTIEPETGATVVAYDGNGNPSWSAAGLFGGSYADPSTCSGAEAYASGRRVTRTYDERNRLRQVLFPDGRGDQLWEYEADGLPKTVTAWNQSGAALPVISRYTYNKRRLPTSESVQQPGWYTWDLGYQYDAAGNLSAQTYPTGLVIDYAPNALGQATRAGSYATAARYYPNGALKQFTYGNGLVHTMTQNARQLPARVTSSGGALDLAYTYDRAGNVSSIWDHARDSGNGHYGRWMTYDGLDRLLSASSCTFGGDCQHRMTYDALDNLRSWKLGGVKDYAQYVYDAQTHRLTSVRDSAGSTVQALTYDLQGNLASKNGQAFEFDFGNRLRNVPGKESYRYDAHGRRVLTTKASGAQTLWHYARSGELMFSWEGPSNQKTQEYVHLAGSLVATISHSWPSNAVLAVRYQHTDGLGSPAAITSETGAVVERHDYEPFGAIIDKPMFAGIGFTGHVMDGGTGLTYMQQRYYDQSLGRFLSVDPVTADPSNGGHFNRYKYANNNPYRFVDPDGRRDERKDQEAEERKRQAGRSGGPLTRARGQRAQASAPARTQSAPQARPQAAPSTPSRPLARNVTELGQNILGGLADRTTMTAEFTAAYGGGLTYERDLRTGKDQVGIIPLGLGIKGSPGASITSLGEVGEVNFRVGSLNWGQGDAPVDMKFELTGAKFGVELVLDFKQGLTLSGTFNPGGGGAYAGMAVMFDDTLVPD